MFFISELLRYNSSACDRLLEGSFPPHRIWDRSLLSVWGLPQARGRMEICMELLSHGSWAREQERGRSWVGNSALPASEVPELCISAFLCFSSL